MTDQRKDEMPLEIWAIPSGECTLHFALKIPFENGVKYIRADLSPTSQWRSMESAPRDGQWILAWHPTGMVRQTKWLADNKGWMMMSEETASQLTHWQPITPPTKALASLDAVLAEGE